MLIKRLPTDQPDDSHLPSRARHQWLTRMAKAGAGMITLSLVDPQIARGANIVAMRVRPAENYAHMTIESDVMLKATHQLIKNLDRLVVDISGLKLNLTLRGLVAKIAPNDPYIRQVRVGQGRPSVVRLVSDLKESVSPQVFALLPIADYRNRLAFDLYPANPSGPLMQLVQAAEDKQERFVVSDGTSIPVPSDDDDPIAALARHDSSASPIKPAIEEPQPSVFASRILPCKVPPSTSTNPPSMLANVPNTPPLEILPE